MHTTSSISCFLAFLGSRFLIFIIVFSSVFLFLFGAIVVLLLVVFIIIILRTMLLFDHLFPFLHSDFRCALTIFLFALVANPVLSRIQQALDKAFCTKRVEHDVEVILKLLVVAADSTQIRRKDKLA